MSVALASNVNDRLSAVFNRLSKKEKNVYFYDIIVGRVVPDKNIQSKW